MPIPRSFDWDEAQRLRAEGWTYTRIAERFGVSSRAIWFACNPEAYAKAKRRSTEWIRENRRMPCKGGCGTQVWMHAKDRSGYCPACLGVVKAGDGVREDELRCTQCEEWKPDKAFQLRVDRQGGARRGRRSYCKKCDKDRRQAYREENRESDRKYDRQRPPRNRKKRGSADAGLVL